MASPRDDSSHWQSTMRSLWWLMPWKCLFFCADCKERLEWSTWSWTSNLVHDRGTPHGILKIL